MEYNNDNSQGNITQSSDENKEINNAEDSPVDSDQVYWIEHLGKKILMCDYANLSREEHLKALNKHFQEVRNFKGDQLLVLMAFAGNTMNKEATDRAKEIENYIKEHSIKHKMSIFGIKGLTRFIAQAIKREINFANSEEEAKNWLISDN
ncbi:hypothetical protein ACFLZ9_01775 [Patescibacteria group bacterium]